MTSALAMAADVRAGRITAASLAETAITALEGDPYVAVTRVLATRARAEAARVDAMVAQGRDPGVLAGVPYGVKDLFDIAGFTTTAGALVHAGAPPASADAEAIARLSAAGAVLVASLNMDAFAYGFATINAHHGTTLNPHDPVRLAGGSSGGSAAAVAGGLLPFALGSDTNGSIRVPASLTGVYGLKPTHGSLPVGGTFPFAKSFDDIGPFASSIDDLRVIWRVLGGQAADGAPQRLAVLGGRFGENVDPAQVAAMAAIAPGTPVIDLGDMARARSAAFLVTAYEGGHLHLADLVHDAMAYDPAVRDRLIAGALLPEAIYHAAKAYQREAQAELADVFAKTDILLAPATPCPAPLIADPRILIDGALAPARADLGIHTQPISFLGLPSLAVPLRRPGLLPLGLQLIAAPGRESTLFAFARTLEMLNIVGVTPPPCPSPFKDTP